MRLPCCLMSEAGRVEAELVVGNWVGMVGDEQTTSSKDRRSSGITEGSGREFLELLQLELPVAVTRREVLGELVAIEESSVLKFVQYSLNLRMLLAGSEAGKPDVKGATASPSTARG